MDASDLESLARAVAAGELSPSELVERVLTLTGSRSAIVRRPLPVDDPRRRRPDITLARRLLGWSPRVPLEEGLRATIAWFAGEAEPRHAFPLPANDDGRPPGEASRRSLRPGLEQIAEGWNRPGA